MKFCSSGEKMRSSGIFPTYKTRSFRMLLSNEIRQYTLNVGRGLMQSISKQARAAYFYFFRGVQEIDGLSGW